MKINVVDGSISFENGMVQRHQNRVQFLGTHLGQASKESLVNEDWRHHDFEPESGLSGTIFFKGDRMDRVFLLMSIPSDAKGTWSEELELERKAKHDSWLRTELGEPPYEYAWGTVTSDYDPRGCVSEIIVTYAK